MVRKMMVAMEIPRNKEGGDGFRSKKEEGNGVKKGNFLL